MTYVGFSGPDGGGLDGPGLGGGAGLPGGAGGGGGLGGASPDPEGARGLGLAGFFRLGGFEKASLMFLPRYQLMFPPT